VNTFLDSDEGKAEVQRQDREAKNSDINGVPHFTIQGPVEKKTEEDLKSFSVRQLKTRLHLRGVDYSNFSLFLSFSFFFLLDQ